MSPSPSSSRRLLLPVALAAACAVAPALAKGTAKSTYVVTNLVSNGTVPAPHTDANLVNTWGVAFNPTGVVWVTNNGSGTSTLYDGLGVPNALVVKVPPATGTGTGSPTGIVFSGTNDFVVGSGTTTGPSRFIFASEDGVISGWAPNVDLNNAQRAVTTAGAVYKGLAVATSSTGARLYATDFKGGHVDMFDSAFHPVTSAGAFVDPDLPKQFKPFGIQTLANQVYVTYARHGSGAASGVADQTDASAPGSIIDIFDADGKFVRRAVAASAGKKPWGLALAPADFGQFSNDLLVGDFRAGTITAYDKDTGALVGVLKSAAGGTLKIPGLWGFQFGNGVNNQPANTLFFAAGSDQGAGVYGSVTLSTGQ